jgi:hypothetical protein
LNNPVQEVGVLAQCGGSLYLQGLLLEFLPDFVEDAWRIVELPGEVRIVLELELRNVWVSLLDQVLLIVWGGARLCS